MSVLLAISGIDVSEYVESGYKIDSDPVYDTPFENMLKQDMAELIGCKVSISANLGLVPSSIAKQILCACDTDSLSVTYATPVEYSATFKRPKVTSELITEDNGGVWDISISMNTDVIPKGGL